MPRSTLSRRRFVGAASSLFAAFSIVPRCAVAGANETPPSEKLNLAAIGVGGRGSDNVAGLAPGNNLMALCDVDLERSARTFAKFPAAKQYRDFRMMFDELDQSIDAVSIATPDHTHAVAAMAAIRRGKHVYCEKPLAHSVFEVRQLMKAAREQNVVTQLGNQGHSSHTIRSFCEWIWDGAIGKVHTIHAGCRSVNSRVDQLGRLQERPPVPETLDWDLWLGPAQDRPYHPLYLPGAWRSWVPFGNGTVGDWVCHVVDPVFWALDLGAPLTIQAQVKDYDFHTQGDSYPKGEIITYQFPAKGDRGPITLHWYSGTEPIPRPEALEPDRKPVETGAVVIGDQGTITYGSHGAGGLRIIPETKMREYQLPEQKIPRLQGHYEDWLNAIRNGTQAGSDFSYGGPLTEIAMLGVVAIKMAGTKLEWDPENLRFTNCAEANQYIEPQYRAGWSL